MRPDVPIDENPEPKSLDLLTAFSWFMFGGLSIFFLPPIQAAYIVISLWVVSKLTTANKSTISKAFDKLVVKPISFIGSLILFIPVVILGLIMLESFKGFDVSYDNYKQRMTNASKDQKIFATNSTLDKVADHKLGNGDLVNMDDQEKELVKENYVMNDNSENSESNQNEDSVNVEVREYEEVNKWQKRFRVKSETTLEEINGGKK